MTKRLLFGFFLLISANANAVFVEGLNEVSVPVTDREAITRLASTKAGLAAAITKLSGTKTVLRHPSIQAMLAKPETYVQRFGYRQLDDDSATTVLDITFDEALIRAELRRQSLPNWSNYRPSTLIWLAIEVNNDRYLLNSESNLKAAQMLNKIAVNRGLPIVLPLLDLGDRGVSVGHVWYDDREPLIAASGRYGVEAIVAGRLYQGADDKWVVRWTLYNRGEEFRSGRDSYTVEGVLKEAVDAIAEQIAQLYSERAQQAEQSAAQTVKVHNLDDFASYVRTVQFLESIECVNGVIPRRIEDRTATFRVRCDAGAAVLTQSIQLGDVLLVASPTSDVTSKPSAIEFRYAR